MAGQERALAEGPAQGPELLLADGGDKGESEKGIIPEGLKTFGQNFWSKTQEVTGDVFEKGKEVTGTVVDKSKEIAGDVAEELKDVDTEKLKKDGKEAAKKGIDVYQGDQSTGNKTLDTIIDFGKEFNPFKGITDKAAEMGEKGLNGEKITDQDLKEAAGAAGRDFILPVPEQLKDAQRLKDLADKTGLSDKVKKAVEQSDAQGNEEGEKKGEEVVTSSKGDTESGTPDVEIVDEAKKVGNKIGSFFKRHLGGDKNKK